MCFAWKRFVAPSTLAFSEQCKHQFKPIYSGISMHFECIVKFTVRMQTSQIGAAGCDCACGVDVLVYLEAISVAMSPPVCKWKVNAWDGVQSSSVTFKCRFWSSSGKCRTPNYVTRPDCWQIIHTSSFRILVAGNSNSVRVKTYVLFTSFYGTIHWTAKSGDHPGSSPAKPRSNHQSFCII